MTVLARVLFDEGIFNVLTAGVGLGVNWTLGFYTATTTTPITTYNDRTAGSANANPITIDASGRLPQIWIPDSQTIKWVLSDNNGVVQKTVDNFLISSVPPTVDASLVNFLANTAPLPIANGGTNASSAATAAANLAVLPTAGGTMTGNITRSTKGCHTYFHDAAMVNPEIFIAPTGGTDPRSGLPGQVWLRY
jgi:hypothetical protein